MSSEGVPSYVRPSINSLLILRWIFSIFISEAIADVDMTLRILSAEELLFRTST